MSCAIPQSVYTDCRKHSKSGIDFNNFNTFNNVIQDFIISYVCNGIKTTLTIEDEHYDNMPYKLADMFAKVIRESDANPQIVIENLKNAFENEI